MNGRCSFGFLSMHCEDTGPLMGVFVGLFMLGVLTNLVLAVLVDNALRKRHPDEQAAMRLHGLMGFVFYVWKDRGRQLGDPKFDKLLDRACMAQLLTYAAFFLCAVVAWFGW